LPKPVDRRSYLVSRKSYLVNRKSYLVSRISRRGLLDPNTLHHIALLDRQHHIHPLGHLAEDGVDPVEMRLRRVGDEELAAAGVLAGVRHRQRARVVLVRVARSLALDLPAGTAGANPRVAGILGERIATLDHEVTDHAMETGAIVELAVGELLEIGDRVRGGIVIQLGGDGAALGHEGGSRHRTLRNAREDEK